MSNNKKTYLSPFIKVDAVVLQDIILVSNAYDQGMDDFFSSNYDEELGGNY